jgi:hypothetical protein
MWKNFELGRDCLNPHYTEGRLHDMGSKSEYPINLIQVQTVSSTSKALYQRYQLLYLDRLA